MGHAIQAGARHVQRLGLQQRGAVLAVPAVDRGGELDLPLRLVGQFAHLGGDGLGELVGVLVEGVRDRQEDPRPLRDVGGAPGGEPLGDGGQDPVDVVGLVVLAVGRSR